MARGYQIRKKDGKLYASPTFTPHVLYAIETVTINNTGVYQSTVTTLDYSDSYLIFFYSPSGGGAHFYTQNSNGKLALLARAYKSNTQIIIYVFDNRVRYIPNRGVFIYNSGKIVYTGNCLPLVIKRLSTSGLNTADYPKGSFAVKPGFGNIATAPISGPGNNYIWIGLCWAADTSGGIIAPQIADGAGQVVFTDPDPEILYIDRTIYDKYRKSGIGY